MGFDLNEKIDRYDIIKPFMKYSFKILKCIYIEICDRLFDSSHLKKHNVKYIESEGFKLNLTLSKEEIYKGFTKGTKANIKRFERQGCKIVEDYTEEFVQVYWDQLVDVFKKQGLRPTYDIDRVKGLINHLKSAHNLLCIKALTPENDCIASLIQIGYNNLSITFGVPSYSNYQKEYRPNEALIWYAINYWKSNGIKIFDFGGGGE